VIRDDGQLFGPNDYDLLGFDLKFGDPPLDNKLWRRRSVMSYKGHDKSLYASAFHRVVAVFDHFIDFRQSFAKQDVMCELSACFSLQSWFLDGFTLIGYPWWNGERGSGKSQAGVCLANTSYLGMVLLSSGSFAAFRDLADYGATIVFDDAENISDSRKADPEKRELALAGNRRDTMIVLKVPNAIGKGWSNRWVHAYCSRSFTSINPPDAVLGSRSVTMPLVRTADPRRANRDPADLQRWPCDWRQLQDDLWTTGLALLTEMKQIWAELDDETEIMGREFEPFRPVLAVARLLERHGVDGLEQRMRSAMWAYQGEKQDMGATDRAAQVLRAVLLQVTGKDASDVSDVSDNSDVWFERIEEIRVQATPLSETIKKMGEENGFETEWATANAVGWQLKALRFEKWRDPKTEKRGRARTIDIESFKALCIAYGILRPSHSDETSETSNPSETSEQTSTDGPKVAVLVKPEAANRVRF